MGSAPSPAPQRPLNVPPFLTRTHLPFGFLLSRDGSSECGRIASDDEKSME